MIIINSDDFGYSPNINKAIYEAFQKRLISSTTTLVNFDEGFNHAISSLPFNQISKDAIGIHFNLTEGIPLTEKIKKEPRFCKEGLFITSRDKPLFKLSKNEKLAVHAELSAQIYKFMSGFGFSPSHIDSHHHIHTEWAILKIVLKVASENGIKAMRISRNTGIVPSIRKRFYKKIINDYICSKGLNTANKFGDMEDFAHSGFTSNSNYEIMVHAKYNRQKLTDLDGISLERKINNLFGEKQRLELNNYSDLNNIKS